MLVIGILLFSTVVLIGRGKNWFKSYVSYYTIFDESYNLQKNSAVKLHDAAIGKVTKIVLIDNQVRVEIAVLEEYQSQITRMTTVTVKSPTFIGDEYLAVIPGKKMGAPLSEGGRIPSVPKKSLTDILADFEAKDTARQLTTIVKNISEVSEQLRDPEGPLQASFTKLETILSHISEAAAQAPLMMDRINTNLLTIDKVGNEAHFDLTYLKKILKDLETSLQRLKDTLANIEDASYDIPQITHSTKKGIEEVRRTVEGTDQVIHSLQQNFLIKRNLSTESEGENIDAGLRQ